MTAHRDLLVVPHSVLAGCVGGVALVMATFLLPPSNLHNVEGASVGWVAEGDSWFRTLPVLPTPSTFNSSRTPSTSGSQVADEPSRIVRERAAADILLRSGFIDMASVSRKGGDERTVSYSMHISEAVERCTLIPHPEATGDPPEISTSPLTRAETQDYETARRLAVAVVAVEKKYRTAPQRWLELRVAQLGLTLFGRLPDFSLGLAQLRPSTVRALPKGSPGEPNDEVRRDDRAMLAALSNDCHALGFAAAVLCSYLRGPEAGEEAASARYVGRSDRAKAAVIDYVPIVKAASEILGPVVN